MATRKKRTPRNAAVPEEVEKNPQEETPDVPEPGSEGEDTPPEVEAEDQVRAQEDELLDALTSPQNFISMVPPDGLPIPQKGYEHYNPADKILVDRLEFSKLWKCLIGNNTKRWTGVAALHSVGMGLLGAKDTAECRERWQEAQDFLKEHQG